MTAVSAVIDRVKYIIQDNTNIRWTEGELLAWATDGQREIAHIRPDSTATVHRAVVTPAVDDEYSIPADGIRLIDVLTTGASYTACRLVDREVLDAQIPDWRSATAAASAKHYIFDVRFPKKFWLYPKLAASTAIELVYAKAPTDLTASTDTLTIGDEYIAPLVDYVCYRAFSKDAEYAGNESRAAAHQQAFVNSLTASMPAAQVTDPNAKAVPFNPVSDGN